MSLHKDRERNTWYFKIRIDGGSTTRRGFLTKREAQEAEYEFLDKLKMGASMKKSIYFSELIEEYFEYQSTNSSKMSTINNLRSLFKVHILPYFGKKRIDAINSRMILHWKKQISLQNFASAYNQKMFIQLNAVFKYAVQFLGLSSNPVSTVENFKTTKVKDTSQNYFTHDEFKRFIAVVNDYEYRVFFTALYYTGLRRGEAQALTWEDIDMVKREIKVSKTCSYKSGNGSYLITHPKTKSSNRKILMDSNLFALISEFYEHCKRYDGFSLNCFVFGVADPFPDNTIDNKKNRYCDLAGVKRITVHGFRHSHASLLINKGANILVVARRLGHKDIKMTLNTYSHMFDSEQEKIVDLIDKL